MIEALERNNVSTGAGYIEHKGEAYSSARPGASRTSSRSATSSSARATARRSTSATWRRVGVGRELRTGSASENGDEVVVGTALMLIGANSRTVAAAVDAKMAEINKTPAAGHPRQDRC